MKIDTIYLDLDGVLANFEKGVLDKTGQSDLITHGSWRKDVFSDPNFFINLEPFWHTAVLIAHCQEIAPVEILTATGEYNPFMSAYGKRIWCETYAPNMPVNIVVESKHKAEYANETSVLIDDNKVKCLEPWDAAGGISIHHITASVTMHKLAQIIKQP